MYYATSSSSLQVSTKELATTSPEEFQRQCVSEVQPMATRQCSRREQATVPLPTPLCSRPMHEVSLLCRLRPLLITALLLSLLHSTAAQVSTQPVPSRCTNDPTSCGFSPTARYRYNSDLHECENYYDNPCGPQSDGEYNTFSSLEDCQNSCLDGKFLIFFFLAT